MSQIIIYENPESPYNVCTCTPANQELIQSIADGIPGSIIIDSSILPTQYNKFFNAWRLVDGNIVVDLVESKNILTNIFNKNAIQRARSRFENTLVGIPNEISDSDFQASISVIRQSILNAENVDDLLLINVDD